MLSDDPTRHVALHEALGFKFRTQRLLLRNFVTFAELRGDRFVSTARVLSWAVEAPSPEQRRNRLLNVRRFAIATHAEDPRHEVPAADALGRGLFRRKLPYIYSTDPATDGSRIVAAAGRNDSAAHIHHAVRPARHDRHADIRSARASPG